MKLASTDAYTLSDKRRALLEILLQEEGVHLTRAQGIPRRTETGPAPLSFAQQRMWFLDQWKSAGHAYHIPCAVRLCGLLHLPALEQSLNEIVKRHEILRTTFAAADGQPVQVIAPNLALPLPVVDLQAMPPHLRELEAQRLACEEVRQPFHLARGPLLRTRLLRLEPEEQVLLLTMHHIVSDGWSLEVFIREVAVFYEALVKGEPARIAELPIQYADYAVWQRAWLQGEVLENQLAYWRKQLAGIPVLELPTDRPRPAMQSFRGARETVPLPTALAEALKELSQREGTTLFMTLLAAFKVLLYRYTGQSDIPVGTPIANRNRIELESLIGFFVNTLVLRTDLSGNPRFRELLKRVRLVTQGAYAHPALPFERLVGEIQPERDTSRNPLFQVVLVVQDAPLGEWTLPALTLSPWPVDIGRAMFDLTLEMTNTGQGLRATVEYNTDLFEAQTTQRMLGHWQRLLEGIAAKPEECLSNLPLLTEREQRQLLNEWNNDQAEYPQDRCVHQWLEVKEQQTPDTVAMTFEESHLTYHALNRQANRLARRLQALGVGADAGVGICADRSPEMVAGLLSILKAGGAYVPLDPAYPPARLAFMIEDAQIQIVLTQPQQANGFNRMDVQTVCLEPEAEGGSAEGNENPQSGASPGNLAYVIYTSGSTGKPKGSLVTHANIIRLFTATDAWFHFGERDTWTLFHSYAFDFSVWEAWGALLYGGRLVVVPYWVSRSPEVFYELLGREQVTVLNQTPSAFRQLMRAEETTDGGQELALRLVIFGGEALDLHSLGAWLDRHGAEHPLLVNMYGITETTVHVTYRPLTEADVRSARGSVIGDPIPDLQTYLLDADQQLLPVGIPGELYVGGAGLARGYLGRPELTAERFVPHPFGARPGNRLYRSGDLGRYLAHGDLEYLGRIDHQVKVRGFRIEMGEIEAVLVQHPAVGQAVVLAYGQASTDKHLAAYVVAKQTPAPSSSELRGFLNEKLPDYMLPSAFVLLESLPLTPNGKLDRQALPAPDMIRPDLDQVFEAPRTPKEKMLAEIWAEVLGLEQVGIHDNFFALGGDSIRSIQIQSLAQKQGLNFKLQQIFQHKTIYELARELEAATPGVMTAPGPAFALISAEDRLKLPEDVEDAYPTVMLQLGMLFHGEYSPDSAATYHDIFSFHLRAPCDPDVLRSAAQQLISRHAVLRTSFDLTRFSEPLQLVRRTVEVPLEVEDLRHLSSGEMEKSLAAWLEAEKRRKFDWKTAPLFRLHLQRRSAETFQFNLSFHHAILDGWSVASLLAELFRLYLALSGREVKSIESPPATPFRDFVALEREAVHSEESRQYWMQKIDGSTVTTLPRRSSLRQAGGMRRIRVREVLLSPEISQGLEGLSRAAGVPIKSILLAAHLKVLSLFSAQPDVLTGLVSHGRREGADGERVLGLFLNTLPFRFRLSEGAWLDLVRQCFAEEQALFPFRRYPLAQIQKMTGGQPLFEAVFNFNHFHVYQGLAGLNEIHVLGEEVFEETNFTFLANFVLSPVSSRLQMGFKYDALHLDPEQIEAIEGYYIRTLEAMVEKPDGRHESYCLLSGRERRLLMEWGGAKADYPQGKTIHQLFAEQVERTPEAMALVFEDQCLTYEQLNRQANQLAHHLRILGVGPDTPVGVCVERSLQMVIGLLAILKAGGAYLPMDPGYPQERLAFMLEDSKARVLLTQSSLSSVISHPSSDPDQASHFTVVCLDRDAAQWTSCPPTDPEPLAGPLSLAYVIYTSGSTGKPKGSMIEHYNLVRLFQATEAWFHFDSGDIWTVFHSVAFDFSVWEIWGPLVYGGRAVMVPYFVSRSPESFRLLLEREQVTVLNQTPSAFRLLIQADKSAGHPHGLSLRYVIFGGEALDPQSLKPWVDGHGARKPLLVNMYGITETTVHVTYRPLGPGDLESPASIIGISIPDLGMYVLDSHLEAVPVGVAGELHVGGAGLARGYLNRPELTAEKFIPDPFGAEPDARLYKTGDLVRWLPDGQLEYLGRTDFQVKIRGFRIELGEIESLLIRQGQVREAIVLSREDNPGDKRLVAYLVPVHKDSPPDTADLRAQLKVYLPDYMVPAAFVVLESLPLTPNGKIDRKALPAPEYQTPAKIHVAPRTPAEEALVKIFSEVLKLERVSVNDNFFELGGHSLLAVTLLERMRQKGLHTDLRALFSTPTLAELAAVIGSQANSVEAPPNRIPPRCEALLPEMLPLVKLSQAEIDRIVATVPGGAVNVQDIYPLAPLQEGILFHYLISSEGDPYLTFGLFRFDARIRLEGFLDALQKVIDRHDILRTAVVWEGLSEPVQVVWRSALLCVEEVVLDAAAGDAAEQLYQRYNPRRLRMNVRQAPLMQAYITHDAAQERWLLLVLYHSLAEDHTTMSFIAAEIQAHLRGKADQLPKPLPFRNFVAQARLGMSQEEHREFFQQMLGDMDEPTTPFGLLDVLGDGTGIEEALLEVDTNLARRLRERARALKVGAASISHLAWAQVLARVSGRDDVVFGTILFGRMQGGEGADQVMGVFINTLPIRIRLGEEGVETSVRRTQALLTDLLRHEHASLSLAQRCSGVHAPAPLFSALMNYRHSEKMTQTLSTERISAWEGIELLSLGDRNNFPFTIEVDDLGEGFRLRAMVQSPIEAGRVCGFMHTALERLVEALETGPGRAMRSLDVLTAAERKKVIEEFNRTKADYPKDRCVHQLFEEQVHRTPETPALVFEDRILTYEQLNRKANQLAHHLRALGVKADTLVAIGVERCLETVVGLLAILKAGGAYVPMDPDYPQERLACMLEDAKAQVLLTRSSFSSAFGLPPSALDSSLSAAGLAKADSAFLMRHASLKTVFLDTDWETVAAQPCDNPKIEAHPESLAYVIYTSGSTGKPKGVSGKHSALVNRLSWMQKTFPCKPGERHVQKTSMNFIDSITETLTPLIDGAQLHIAGREIAMDPRRLCDFIEDHAIDRLTLVPSLLDTLLKIDHHAIAKKLKLIVSSGEILPQSIVDAIHQKLPSTVLINLYGSSEITGDATYYVCDGMPGAKNRVSIGRPIGNTSIYLLDGNGQPAPIGVPGELCVGGSGLARGYLNRPELTAEKFIPDPFGTEPDARLYKTGDLARWLPDGDIEYLGRTDFQVKIRGFRIELGEIESALTQHAPIREAIVLAREDNPGDKRLVAYVVPAGGDTSLDIAELRVDLKANLPDYMVPAAFVLLRTLPLTPNGKVDRKALPRPEYQAPIETYLAPRTHSEEALVKIFSEVLGIERVGVNDNFFKLGGHSLLAVTLLERMRQSGLQVDLRALFTTPTLAELALAVSSQASTIEVPPNAIPLHSKTITPEMLPLVKLSQAEIDRILATVPGGATNVQDIYPLAPLQEGILFHHLLNTEGDAYLLSSLFVFDTRDRLEVFLNALQKVIDRHDILRTAVVWENLSEAVQVVWRRAPLIKEEMVLDPAGGEAVEQLYQRFHPRRTRMDLGRAPLYRGYIVQDPPRNRWLLLVLHHHLAGDHTTMGVIREEIRAHLLGQADQLPQALPFRNFVAQARLGISQEEHREFFRQMLGDVDEPTAPFGLLDVQGDGSGIEEALLEVDAQLARRLRERARALKVSAAGLCHLAWALVLARVSGRADVVFGTVLFGRMQGGEGAERVMGMFINTLPIRIRIRAEGVEESARQTHDLLTNLMRHEHASLALAQRCSGVPAPMPLFSALFNYRHSREPAHDTPSAEAPQIWKGVEQLSGEERSNYPFDLSVNDLGTGFSLTAQMPALVGPRRVCGFMHGALERLVEALERTPKKPLNTLDVLPEIERRQVLEEFNRTGAEIPHPSGVQQLFEGQAARTPEAVALVFEGQVLTYARLNRRANQLAHHLRALGVKADTLVAIGVERCLEMVVGLLAILKAGGAYVPMDPDYPQERLAFMLEDSQAQVLLTQSSLSSVISHPSSDPDQASFTVVCLDRDAAGWSSCPFTNPEPLAGPLNLAYVIYTSGSTGRPKGVMIRRRSLVHAYLAWEQIYELHQVKSHLQMANVAFDVFSGDLVRALCSGGKLILCPRDDLLAPDLLCALMQREQVECAEFVPAVLKELVRYLEERQQSLDFMRLLICGSDVLRVDEYSRILRLCKPATRLLNTYGLTEATIDSSYFETRRVDRLSSEKAVPIGRPFPNTRLYILDGELQPMPVGVPGELYVGGGGVAGGYWNRPELTAEKFIPDPFSPDPAARLYKTGDLGRWLPDGNMEYLGRTDFQIKLRGLRIELGEIESVLRQHPRIREAIVLAREEMPGETRLVAYLVPAHKDAPPDMIDLRAFLKQRLSEAVMPSAFVMLEALPLTPNGKVDRKALPAPEYQAPVETYAAPRTPTQEILVKIFSDVLGLERVGIHDNFFNLGGHSLLATQVVSRIRQALGVELSLRQLFATPVILDLSIQMDGTCPPALLTAIPIVERDAPLPLTFAQERLWFLDQLEGGGTSTYLMPAALRLRGPLNVPAVCQTLQAVVHRHEVLRTSLPMVDGEARQVIDPPGENLLPIVDLRDLPANGREQETQRCAQQDAVTGFDLSRGPLIRFALLQLESEEHVFLVNMHHIISDGWSVQVLANEIVTLYIARIEGREDPLPKLPIQNADYAVWQRSWLNGQVLQDQIDYWRKQLAGLPPLLTLPTDYPRPSVQTFAGQDHSFMLDAGLTGHLKALGQACHATLFMTLASAFAVLLGRHAGQTDLAIGVPIANRTREELEGLIGFLVNTLVLRASLEGNPSFIELLNRMKRTCLDAYAHQDVALGLLVDELNPERSLSYNQLFQVMFILQNTPQSILPLPGFSVVPLNTKSFTSKFDLTLSVTEYEGVLYASFEYSTDLFTAGTVERMAGHFKVLLEGMVSNPDSPVNVLPLLPETERSQILEEFNRTGVEIPRHSGVQQLFEEQAVRTPEAVALVFEGQVLTYERLNRRANRLARHLRALGIKADTLVGICMERSLEMVIGLLAILKAGGAYVPMDPDYPQERLAFMLEDSQVRVLLTQSSLSSVISHPSSDPDRASRFTVVCLDRDAARWSSCPVTNPEPLAGPLNLAYVIYTSGTTGQPKGVMVEQRSLLNLVHASATHYALSAGDRILQFTSISFDFAAEEIYPIFSVGGALILRSDEMLSASRVFLERCRDFAITVLDLPTSYWRTLVNDLAADPAMLPPILRLIIIGGEAALPDTVATWHQKIGSYPCLMNSYGPTEATVVVTLQPLMSSATYARHISIGRPVANTQVYILDQNGRPVPIGVSGELHIGGVQVARGYLKRPELTAEKFIPDPFSPDPNAKLYKTGDLARWQADGEIEYLGRSDFQVKIRGFRIELGEIESALTQHPQVREAIVLSREDNPGDKRLVAYLVPARQENPPETADLRDHLKAGLPEYMVPSAFMVLDSLPLTPNGKVDRKALPKPEYQAPAETYVAPRTPMEQALAEIFGQVLGLERVGIHENFFALGGHSLMAVQVIARIRQQMKIDLPLTVLFEAGSVEAIARQLDHPRKGGAWSPLVRLRLGTNSGVPIFCFPGAGGIAASFLPLARHWHDGAAVYGLQSRGLGGDIAPHKSVEEIAHAQMDHIRKIGAEGPYRLVGHSFGGWVAFEVARQLSDQGLVVDPVLLLDSRAPRRDKKRRRPLEFRQALIAYAVSIERTTGRSLGLTPAALKERNEDGQLLLLKEALEKAKVLPMDSALEVVRGLLRVYAANSHMSYAPGKTYHGQVWLVQAKGFWAWKNTRAWKSFAPVLRSEQAPGGHETMLQEPHVETLTAILRKAWRSG